MGDARDVSPGRLCSCCLVALCVVIIYYYCIIITVVLISILMITIRVIIFPRFTLLY